MAAADYLAKYLSAEDAEQQLGVKKKKRRKPKWQGPGPGAYNVDDSKVSAPPSGLRLRFQLRFLFAHHLLCLHSCQR